MALQESSTAVPQTVPETVFGFNPEQVITPGPLELTPEERTRYLDLINTSPYLQALVLQSDEDFTNSLFRILKSFETLKESTTGGQMKCTTVDIGSGELKVTNNKIFKCFENGNWVYRLNMEETKLKKTLEELTPEEILIIQEKSLQGATLGFATGLYRSQDLGLRNFTIFPSTILSPELEGTFDAIAGFVLFGVGDGEHLLGGGGNSINYNKKNPNQIQGFAIDGAGFKGLLNFLTENHKEETSRETQYQFASEHLSSVLLQQGLKDITQGYLYSAFAHIVAAMEKFLKNQGKTTEESQLLGKNVLVKDMIEILQVMIQKESNEKPTFDFADKKAKANGISLGPVMMKTLLETSFASEAFITVKRAFKDTKGNQAITGFRCGIITELLRLLGIKLTFD